MRENVTFYTVNVKQLIILIYVLSWLMGYLLFKNMISYQTFLFYKFGNCKKMLNIQISRLSDVNLTSSNQFNSINKISNLNIILKIY